LKTQYVPPREPGTYRLRGNNGSLLTISLFYEPATQVMPGQLAADQKPVFSLSERDGYVSARLTFLEERDPTGVTWAEKWLEGVNHLNRLLQADWFREAFEVWQSECEQLLQSEALDKIRTISNSSSPAAFQAAKYLAGKDWKKNSRGRPSKAELAGALKKEVDRMSAEDHDLARISGRPNLKVV
jgi:hypothetical protein